MNFTGWGLLVSVVFGAIGVGYLMYGRRETRVVFAVGGLVLMGFPWFVSDLWALIGIGIALVTAPFAAAWWFGI